MTTQSSFNSDEDSEACLAHEVTPLIVAKDEAEAVSLFAEKEGTHGMNHGSKILGLVLIVAMLLAFSLFSQGGTAFKSDPTAPVMGIEVIYYEDMEYLEYCENDDQCVSGICNQHVQLCDEYRDDRFSLCQSDDHCPSSNRFCNLNADPYASHTIGKCNRSPDNSWLGFCTQPYGQCPSGTACTERGYKACRFSGNSRCQGDYYCASGNCIKNNPNDKYGYCEPAHGVACIDDGVACGDSCSKCCSGETHDVNAVTHSQLCGPRPPCFGTGHYCFIPPICWNICCDGPENGSVVQLCK